MGKGELYLSLPPSRARIRIGIKLKSFEKSFGIRKEEELS
jgi:hypothetical protein